MNAAFEDQLRQITLESEAVANIGEAVKTALDWHARPELQGRKAAALREVATTYVAHLVRLLGLEEESAAHPAVDDALPDHPELANWQSRLLDESVRLRREAGDVQRQLDAADSPSDAALFDLACRALQTLLRHVAQHNAGEIDLLQEMWTRDTGGGD